MLYSTVVGTGAFTILIEPVTALTVELVAIITELSFEFCDANTLLSLLSGKQFLFQHYCRGWVSFIVT